MIKIPPLDQLSDEDDADIHLASMPECDHKPWFETNGLGRGAEDFNEEEINIVLEKTAPM